MGYIGGSGKGLGKIERYIYTATGGETSVTADDLSRTPVYKPGNIDVFLNGVKQVNGTDFTATSGNSITGLTALTADDVVEIIAFDTYATNDSVSKSQGGTFSGKVSFDQGADFSSSDVEISSVNGGQIGGNRNLIINGGMNVAQRGTSSTIHGYGTVDRYQSLYSGGTVTQEQSSIDIGGNLAIFKALKTTNTTSSSATSAYRQIIQTIEGLNVYSSGWDFNSADSFITVSFYVMSTVAGTYYARITSQEATVQNFVWGFDLEADTWSRVTKTIPGNAVMNMPNNTNAGIALVIMPWLGTDYTSSSAILDSWHNYNGSAITPDFSHSFASTASSIFYLTGVQIEPGNVATEFQHVSYVEELQKCKRYYESVTALAHNTAWGTIANSQSWSVEKRVTPIVSTILYAGSGAAYTPQSTTSFYQSAANNSLAGSLVTGVAEF